MTFIVGQGCINCKHTDCVEVCPVDCFYEGENTLVINPDECIDCGLCEPECPIEAIYAEDEVPADQIEFIEINEKYSKIWPDLRIFFIYLNKFYLISRNFVFCINGFNGAFRLTQTAIYTFVWIDD